MDLAPFLLERVFARHEFSARRMLSSSDCEALSMAELLSWADDETRAQWDGLRLGYTESRGLPLLLREIAALYPGTTLERNTRLIHASLAALARFDERHDLFEGPPPRAGWVTLRRLRRPEGATAFCERLVREAGLFLVASSSFHFGDAHVRLGLGRADFPVALDELDAWLRAT